MVAARDNSSASRTGKARVRNLIFHPPEQIGPNSDRDTQASPEKFQNASGGCLGRFAVALLVLLAGAARARIIAADFRAGASRLGGFRRPGARLDIHFPFLAAP